MNNSDTVFYFDGTGARPRPARLLLYNGGAHLYETGEDHFIAAFPYSEVHLISNDNSYHHFSLLPDRSQALDVANDHPLLPELLIQSGKTKKGLVKRLSGLKLPVLVLLVAAVVAGLYFLLVAGLSGVALQLISPKKEAELGKIIYDNMISGSQVDTNATAMLTRFASNLKLSDKYQLQFTVLDEDEINAFAIPGGHIVVYKGILKKMQRPEELVALLGHESTHVNERHSLRNMLQQMTGGILLSMVFGDLGSMGSVVAERANALQSLSYSRGLESEADEKGMEKMITNHVDPAGMVKLMDRLKEAEKDYHLPGFLSSHPLTAERKEKAQQFVRDHGFRAQPLPALDKEWQTLKAEVGDDVPSRKIDGDRE
ncbi:M48 family metallopeptidase [Flavihumibacter petaseus]|uniref:Peptidase M48 family protein n=1 Tax=Flavihumibacter petaseus NBRC 106054 TaxID=1220578 RepID=A0A0E9N0U8_9BACT|nr:M48 family metallopeptidase [Flavihumibacter petaseus]GAO43459.1 peptidase M48 family protein [Flavihumibacter petaseus NBRC 106054]